MRLGRTFRTSALILGLSALAVGTASAAPRHRYDSGRELALQLEATTDRIHSMGDATLRGRGRRAQELAVTLHRMDQWARYYRASVEREGFRSLKARQRFDRFLVEYHATCALIDRPGRPFARIELARLHATVAELNGRYGMHVARRGDRDRWDDGNRWDDDDRWDDDRRDRRDRRH